VANGLGRLKVLLIVLYVVALAGLALLATQHLVDAREEVAHVARQRASDLAATVEQQVSRAIGETDAVLGAMAEKIAQSGGTSSDPRELYILTVARQRALPQTESVVVLDAEGRLLSHTSEHPYPGANSGAWAFLVEQATTDPARAVVGRAVRDPLHGGWTIPLLRRLPGADGGVIAALVKADYFGGAIRGLALPDTAELLIARSDGRLLAAHPIGAREPDQDLAGLPPFRLALAGDRTGSFHEILPGGPGTRIGAFQRSTDYPLVATVSIALEAALDPWRREASLTIGAAVLLAALGALVCLAIYNEARRRAEAADSLRKSNRILEFRLRERNASVDRLASHLSTFSYSISHDLRTPLRAINGFCQALEEDYGEKLDANGRDYLLRVRKASERMGEYIDKLVDLTGLSQATVSRAQIDLSDVARLLAGQLRSGDANRQVVFDIAPQARAHADPRLAQLLLAQLFDNAWKFTRARADARISFGASQEPDGTVFFVDDNGIGFDMTHAGKLFEPFQRVHSDSAYEGSGIGLAMAKRIVELHGGRIWADAVPGQGVTFYFTLAPSAAPADGRAPVARTADYS
jgi:signal transduction histidine kinase